MNKIILIISCIFFTLSYAQENEKKLIWLTDIDVAKSKAKSEHKPILMLFTGSDWCPPCKQLKKDFFNTEEFVSKSNKFVLLLVDFPKNKKLINPQQEKANKLLNSDYGVGSLPTLIAIDYRGNIIDKIKSYNAGRDTRYYFEFIDNLIK